MEWLEKRGNVWRAQALEARANMGTTMMSAALPCSQAQLQGLPYSACSLLEAAKSTPRMAPEPEGCTCRESGGSAVTILWLGSQSLQPTEGDT